MHQYLHPNRGSRRAQGARLSPACGSFRRLRPYIPPPHLPARPNRCCVTDRLCVLLSGCTCSRLMSYSRAFPAISKFRYRWNKKNLCKSPARTSNTNIIFIRQFAFYSDLETILPVPAILVGVVTSRPWKASYGMGFPEHW